jgi:hypothetical protein
MTSIYRIERIRLLRGPPRAREVEVREAVPDDAQQIPKGFEILDSVVLTFDVNVKTSRLSRNPRPAASAA